MTSETALPEVAGPAIAGRYTAVVLAGRRSPDDDVAQMAGVANKCLADAAGASILLRVVRALRAVIAVGRIHISTDDAALMHDHDEIGPVLAKGGAILLGTGPSAPESVIAAAREIDDPFPMLVVAGDHALLSPEMVAHFVAASDRETADLTVALATASAIRARFPDARRTFLRFRDEAYSGCNLFALRSPAALPVLEFWAEAGRHRKQPLRLVRQFGIVPLVLYALRRLTLHRALAMASRKLSVEIAPVIMPQAEAAVDVDKPSDLELVRDILAVRERSAN